MLLKEAKLPFDRLTKSKIICFIQCLKQAKFPSKSGLDKNICFLETCSKRRAY